MKAGISVLIIAGLMSFRGTLSQDVLTLKDCYDRAFAVNAIAKENQKHNSIYELKDKNLSKGWFPSVDANTMIVYNSEVVDIGSSLGSLPIPGIADAIKPLPHEQYRVTVDINQPIYDGGAIKNARVIEKSELAVNQKQTESDLYKIRSQINGFYFNILLVTKQKELQQTYLQIIEKRLASMESALRNGVILKSDIDVLTSEKLKLEQQIREIEIKEAALLKILSGFTGTELDTSAVFVMPVQTVELSGEIRRPELELFDLRREQLSAGMKIIDIKRMPKAFGFATLGYGNPPGNNFFRDEFAPYYIVGAGIKWNILDWNKSKNEKQVINLRQDIIDGRKKDLEDNLNRMLDSKKAEISSFESLIETDAALIGLRKRITAAAESQYENGIITATEYLNEMNSERQALINHEIHKINLALAIIEYLNISGTEIE